MRIARITAYRDLIAELTIKLETTNVAKLRDEFQTSPNRVSFFVVRNETTNTFTPFGYIELLSPVREELETIYAICNKYRRYFYYREAITNVGSINIWIYGTIRQYKKHVEHILTTCRENR